MTTEVSDTQSVHIIFIERDFISTTIGQMSGEHISTTWRIGLEYKNDTNDSNKWLWLDGKPVDVRGQNIVKIIWCIHWRF